MAQSKTTISTRLTEADTAFLHELEINGARTPSEKLRKIVAQARHRAKGTSSYADAKAFLDDVGTPGWRALAEHEYREGMHSEVLRCAATSLPDAMAYLLSAVREPCEGPQTLRELEAGTVDRLIRLFEQLLRLAVTRHAPCYDPTVIRSRLEPLREIWNLIETHDKKREGDAA